MVSFFQDRRNLLKFQASVFSPSDLAGHLKNVDAVVSCLGYKGAESMPFRTMKFYLPSAKAIVQAMKDAKVLNMKFGEK
jgi:hypothetical protein